jgi:hypothetical protein
LTPVYWRFAQLRNDVLFEKAMQEGVPFFKVQPRRRACQRSR